MGDALYLCAKGLGYEFERRCSELLADFDKPPAARRHETTLAEAEANWQQMLADSRRMVEENGGEVP